MSTHLVLPCKQRKCFCFALTVTELTLQGCFTRLLSVRLPVCPSVRSLRLLPRKMPFGGGPLCWSLRDASDAFLSPSCQPDRRGSDTRRSRYTLLVRPAAWLSVRSSGRRSLSSRDAT